MNNTTEQVLQLTCEGQGLTAIHHAPSQPSATGVVIIVGGPQYRVGSHRQFVLLARHLATTGTPVLRFDYRGMGDSDGEPRDFEHISLDIGCAIDALCTASPAVNNVILWGLCDAASAAALYAPHDQRVSGLVLLNPWLRTAQSEAQTHLKHYFLQRLRQAEFWRKLFSEPEQIVHAASSLIEQCRQALRQTQPTQLQLPERMLGALQQFSGRVLLILSGNDLTAKEFVLVADHSPVWRALLSQPRFQRQLLPNADHTFSSQLWRDQVARWTSDWL